MRLLVGVLHTPLAAGEPDRELPPLQPGQPVDGRVEQAIRAGYIVSVRGRSFEVKLPDGTRPGDLLRLVYLHDNPRPTFALLRIEHASEHAGSKLSDAGKMLAMLQEIRTEAPGEPVAGESAPVFQTGIPETAKAATLLHEALTLSGLFFESHQAQWVLGMRSTAQLQREPQGRLAPMQPAADAETAQPPSPGASEQAMRRADATPAQAPHTTEPGLAPQREQAARSPAHPDTFPIIRQQLSALESGCVAWHGVVWPGQSMQWQVGDGASRAGDDSEVPRTWRTELKLTLPNIGELRARIELDANGARLRLLADSEPHARRLREEAPALADRFDASGIPVRQFEVSHGPETA